MVARFPFGQEVEEHIGHFGTAARGVDRGAGHAGVSVGPRLQPAPGMVMTASRLLVEDLSYGYRGHIVGHHVSFAVGAGEVLCVLGRNGEGKSTLFKTVLGLLPPLAGTVRVDGQPISGWNARRRALSFGYVKQSGVGGFPFTLREIVLMGRTAHRRQRSRAIKGFL